MCEGLESVAVQRNREDLATLSHIRKKLENKGLMLSRRRALEFHQARLTRQIGERAIRAERSAHGPKGVIRQVIMDALDDN